MSKVTAPLALVLTIMAQTALASESRSDRMANPTTAKSTEGQRSKGATTIKGSPTTADPECKKYFAIIGSVVDVPCSKGATTIKDSPTTADPECKKYFAITGSVVDVPCPR